MGIKRGKNENYRKFLTPPATRGISEVVTWIIGIAITLVLITTVWLVISNIVTKQTENIDLGDVKTSLSVNRRSFVYSQGGINLGDEFINLSVKRESGDAKIKALKFIVSNDKDSVVIRKEGVLESLNSNSFSLNVSNIVNATKIEIVPIYENEKGKEVQGNIAVSYKFDINSFGKELACFQDSNCVNDTDSCTSHVCLNKGTSSSSCSTNLITQCSNGDGCCIQNCNPADSDCGTSSSSSSSSGGSSTSSSSSSSSSSSGGGAVCGNGIKETGEGCDDGDALNWDGCSSACAVESGWLCSGSPSVCVGSCVGYCDGQSPAMCYCDSTGIGVDNCADACSLCGYC